MPRTRFTLRDVATKTLEHRWRPDVDSVDADVIAAMGALNVEKGGLEALARINAGMVEKAVALPQHSGTELRGMFGENPTAVHLHAHRASKKAHAGELPHAVAKVMHENAARVDSEAADAAPVGSAAYVRLKARAEMHKKAAEQHGTLIAEVVPEALKVVTVELPATGDAAKSQDADADDKGGKDTDPPAPKRLTAKPAPKSGKDEDDKNPEDALKPLIVAAYRSWAGAVRGEALPQGSPAWVTPVEGENAAAFAKRASGEIAKLPQSREAMASVGHGQEWEDWVAATMRYDGSGEKPKDVAKALEDLDPIAALNAWAEKALGAGGAYSDEEMRAAVAHHDAEHAKHGRMADEYKTKMLANPHIADASSDHPVDFSSRSSHMERKHFMHAKALRAELDNRDELRSHGKMDDPFGIETPQSRSEHVSSVHAAMQSYRARNPGA